MAKNTGALKRGFHYDPKTQTLGIYVNGYQTADFTQRVGRTYYVNNITGGSSNDGLSWENCVAEIDQAVTLAEAYRQSLDTGNQNTRNTIVIQATNTPYDNVDTEPYWADFIGLGSNPYGNGQGIVVIGAGASEDAWADSGYFFGNYLYNIQMLVATDAYWAQDLGLVVQCTWDTCAFTTSKAGDMSSGGGLRASTAFGGNIIKNCTFNTQGSGQLHTGIYMTGANNNNRIIENTIYAASYGINIAGTDTNNLIARNYISSGRASAELTVGIACKTHSLVANNFIVAADAISGATAGNTVDNQVTETGVAARELA